MQPAAVGRVAAAGAASPQDRIFGVDFSSAPSRRKPIAVVEGMLQPAGDAVTGQSPAPARLALRRAFALETLAAFEQWLQTPGPWVAGFDLPFGLPAAFVDDQGWPAPDWPAVTAQVGSLTRPALVARCRAYADARPAGHKFAHRATDRPAGSSPSMKWVNPPVVLMLHAGAPRLLAADVGLPAHGVPGRDPGDRIALEAYPGLLARQLIGRVSYKSDDRRRDDAGRRERRECLADRLERAGWSGIRVDWPDALRGGCIADGRGDCLDAVLCAVQAAWSAVRRDAGWGLPAAIDPVEGWIVGALDHGRSR